MGWMSWEVFRCETDCAAHPDACIDEHLYKQMADALQTDGYVAAGYKTISIDDCWEAGVPGVLRRPGAPLQMNATRFPSGPKSLSDYIHKRGAKFGIYSDEGTATCEGYPASQGYEDLDAQTFAAWGVDYLKLDGCNNDVSNYATGYAAMGQALQKAGRDVVYSCSWPAYIGDDEAAKPYDAMAKAGCHLWRNWHDVQCSWSSVRTIMNHFGNNSAALEKVAGPGRWNDPDMLLAGNDCVTDAEATTQMVIWSILAAPLIMGNDLRHMSDPMKKLLLNPEIIAIDQDPLGLPGRRRTKLPGTVEVWTRELRGGDLAVAVYFDKPGKFPLVAVKVGWTPLLVSVRDVVRRESLGVFRRDAVISVESTAAHAVRLYRLSRIFGPVREGAIV